AWLLSQDFSRIHGIYARKELSIPSTDQTGRGGDLRLPELRESGLSSIEVEAYGVQLSGVVRAVVRWINSPNTITGRIAESGDSLVVYAEYRDSKKATHRWFLTDVKKPEDASFSLACRITRALEAERSPAYALASDGEFYAFTRALRSYQQYSDDLSSGKAGLEDLLNDADARVSALAKAHSRFPFVYKLQAFILRDRGKPSEARDALQSYLASLPKPVADSEAQ